MTGPSGDPREPTYLLGHEPRELRRLDQQGELYRDISVDALRSGGVGKGMRVLDLGCGTGSLSIVAGGLVGSNGAVLGVDRSAASIRAARAHAAELGAGQVEFAVGEITGVSDHGPFDAVVGRFVLMHQADPVATLRSALRAVRDGGVAVMIESWIGMLNGGVHSEPASPLYDELIRWKMAVVEGAGADARAGAHLRSIFDRAGLRATSTRLSAPIHGGADSAYYEYVVASVRSMLPEAARLGLPAYSEKDLDTLADRLRDEVVGSNGVLVAWPVVTAWANKG